MRPIIELLTQLDDELLTKRRTRDPRDRARERAPTQPIEVIEIPDEFCDEGPTLVRRHERRETDDERTRVFRVIK